MVSKYSILIVSLIIIAAILGVIIYLAGGNLPNKSGGTNNKSQNSSLLSSNNDIVGEEAEVLSFSSDMTEEQKLKHNELVGKLAKEGPSVNVTGCKPSPLVYKLKDGSTITLRNDDSVEHIIMIDPAHIYTAKAKSLTKIVADFGQGPGNYGYKCDDSQGAAGVFLVTS